MKKKKSEYVWKVSTRKEKDEYLRKKFEQQYTFDLTEVI